MWYRRALYRTQFWAAILLPVFMLVARSVVGGGWNFFGYLFIAPVLAIALGAVAGITRARRSVRAEKAVAPADAIILTLWYLTIIGHSIAWTSDTAAALALIGVLIGLGAFWNAIAQLIRETKQRMDVVIASFETPMTPPEPPATRPPGGYDPRLDQGPVIRIEPPESSPDR
ncbi:MFS transporter [Diaminobutyricimonas sp. TR449]|uniref:MFS transporter n=1 Tax=Diaminobutyricimonas sp. TR449 TaxID=2708076 RepID=UPI0014215FB3|nr:MFS transporter [Diaminobutyricimonas sp. TR449]